MKIQINKHSKIEIFGATTQKLKISGASTFTRLKQSIKDFAGFQSPRFQKLKISDLSTSDRKLKVRR